LIVGDLRFHENVVVKMTDKVSDAIYEAEKNSELAEVGGLLVPQREQLCRDIA